MVTSPSVCQQPSQDCLTPIHPCCSLPLSDYSVKVTHGGNDTQWGCSATPGSTSLCLRIVHSTFSGPSGQKHKHGLGELDSH